MTQSVKIFMFQLEDLSLILGTHVKAGDGSVCL